MGQILSGSVSTFEVLSKTGHFVGFPLRVREIFNKLGS